MNNQPDETLGLRSSSGSPGCPDDRQQNLVAHDLCTHTLHTKLNCTPQTPSIHQSTHSHSLNRTSPPVDSNPWTQAPLLIDRAVEPMTDTTHQQQADCWDDWSDDDCDEQQPGQDMGRDALAPSPPMLPAEVDEARIVHFEEQIKVSYHSIRYRTD